VCGSKLQGHVYLSSIQGALGHFSILCQYSLNTLSIISIFNTIFSYILLTWLGVVWGRYSTPLKTCSKNAISLLKSPLFKLRIAYLVDVFSVSPRFWTLFIQEYWTKILYNISLTIEILFIYFIHFLTFRNIITFIASPQVIDSSFTIITWELAINIIIFIVYERPYHTYHTLAWPSSILLNKLPSREFLTFIFVYNLQLLICIFTVQQTMTKSYTCWVFFEYSLRAINFFLFNKYSVV